MFLESDNNVLRDLGVEEDDFVFIGHFVGKSISIDGGKPVKIPVAEDGQNSALYTDEGVYHFVHAKKAIFFQSLIDNSDRVVGVDPSDFVGDVLEFRSLETEIGPDVPLLDSFVECEEEVLTVSPDEGSVEVVDDPNVSAIVEKYIPSIPIKFSKPDENLHNIHVFSENPKPLLAQVMHVEGSRNDQFDGCFIFEQGDYTYYIHQLPSHGEEEVLAVQLALDCPNYHLFRLDDSLAGKKVCYEFSPQGVVAKEVLGPLDHIKAFFGKMWEMRHIHSKEELELS